LFVPRGGWAGDTLRLSPGEFLSKWFGEYPHLIAASMFALGYLLLIYLGCAISVWAILRGDGSNVFPHLLVLGVALYLIGLSAGPEAYVRFRAPVMPLLTPYAGSGLLTAFDKLRQVGSNRSAKTT
jgi:hypothetical protein